MQSCYVALPFGKKTLANGLVIDYDDLYDTVIRPSVEKTGMECTRGGVIGDIAVLRRLLNLIITSDFMIADVSTYDANLIYQIGVRHALYRGGTILIAAGRSIPALNISGLSIFMYELDSDGEFTDASAAMFRKMLESYLSSPQRSSQFDSPIYDYFPDLEVILPSELEESRQRKFMQNKAQREFVQHVVQAPERVIDNLRRNEVEIRQASQSDPVEYLKLLRKYRDLSEWTRLIALATEAPPEISNSLEVKHMLALALNRRGESGDQERAIGVLRQLIDIGEGNSETDSILGLIYKDRYDQARARKDRDEMEEALDKAIHYYWQGFTKNPRDHYLGINVVTLLLQRSDKNLQKDLDQVVPLVRTAVQEKIDSGYAEFWDYSAALEIAVITRDWETAKQIGQKLASDGGTSEWMLETTRRTIKSVSQNMRLGKDKEQLDAVIGNLRRSDEEDMLDD